VQIATGILPLADFGSVARAIDLGNALRSPGTPHFTTTMARIEADVLTGRLSTKLTTIDDVQWAVVTKATDSTHSRACASISGFLRDCIKLSWRCSAKGRRLLGRSPLHSPLPVVSLR
jgi:hypothetical protein